MKKKPIVIIYMSWFEKNCQITIMSAQIEAAAPLGIGGPPNNGLHLISNTYSFDINMHPDCNEYSNSISAQKENIKKVFNKYLEKISYICIYPENESFTRVNLPIPNQEGYNYSYNSTGGAKLHWHGMLTTKDKMNRKEYIEFFKKIMDHFTIKSQTNKHRALFFKRVTSRQHKEDRMYYMKKQLSPHWKVKPIYYKI